jgi:hypothetical protein
LNFSISVSLETFYRVLFALLLRGAFGFDFPVYL